MPVSISIVLSSYFIGAVPVAYLTGRLLGGIDLRRHGSKNVGASNVFQSVSHAAVVPVGLAEIGQGMLGILIAKLADEDLGTQVVAGLAAIAGHNWSPFLRFSGGRGVAHAIGFMAVLSLPALGAFIVISVIGVAIRTVPQLILLAIVVAPFAALARDQSPEIVAGLAAMVGLLIAKRLITNDPAIPDGLGARDVLLTRLLYDRDMRDRDEWVRRGLGSE